MTPAEFWDRLDRHDWHYAMSDDRSVYARGAREAEALIHLAKAGGQAFRDLLDAFHDHHHSGQPFGTQRSPKPRRPANDP